jgi:hypothetical protein
MAGKYNQVLFVRFSQEGRHSNVVVETSDVCQSVTPQRQTLVVPYHLQEIKSWLRPGVKSGGKKASTPSEKSVEICQKRLNASLLMSQYDCL